VATQCLPGAAQQAVPSLYDSCSQVDSNVQQVRRIQSAQRMFASFCRNTPPGFIIPCTMWGAAPPSTNQPFAFTCLIMPYRQVHSKTLPPYHLPLT
jgi:hypothetical protein